VNLLFGCKGTGLGYVFIPFLLALVLDSARSLCLHRNKEDEASPHTSFYSGYQLPVVSYGSQL
jgi:hypothetical protein